jgi:hypothetical protein
MARGTNRTPAQIAADEANAAVGRIEKAVKRVTAAEAEVAKAKADVGRVRALATYAAQHPDLSDTDRAAFARRLAALDGEDGEDDGIITEPVAAE